MTATSKLTVNVANPANNLIFARVSTAQRDAHFDSNNPPEVGMLIFNDDDKVLEYWNGTEWKVALGERTGGAGVSLYDFSSFEYEEYTSNRTGPTLQQVQNRISGNDNWKSDSSYLNVSNGVWEWTVAASGNYKIECWGAQGGRSNAYGPNGGQGAYATGTMRLKGGDKLKIVVGRRGGGGYYDAGGGGGTYVTTSDNEALVCAGGGGGGSASGMNGPGPWWGTNTQNGGATAWGNGGSNGSGGWGGGAGGGGGLTGNGQGSYYGRSFTNGSQGGPGPAPGGFGGGGGGGSFNGAGGGGGYSGGAASYWSFFGSGGGSFVTSDATTETLTANNKSNHGKVAITKV